jgi:hypothetical protein
VHNHTENIDHLITAYRDKYDFLPHPWWDEDGDDETPEDPLIHHNYQWLSPRFDFFAQTIPIVGNAELKQVSAALDSFPIEKISGQTVLELLADLEQNWPLISQALFQTICQMKKLYEEVGIILDERYLDNILVVTQPRANRKLHETVQREPHVIDLLNQSDPEWINDILEADERAQELAALDGEDREEWDEMFQKAIAALFVNLEKKLLGKLNDGESQQLRGFCNRLVSTTMSVEEVVAACGEFLKIAA